MGDFSNYSLITTAVGKLKAVSPIRVGAGKEFSVVTSDLPVIKNSKGEPIIPGSSIKGFFRGNLQKILLTKMKEKEANELLNEIFGGTEEIDHASAILFHEIPVKDKTGKVIERKHIAINPETGGVRNLFDVECVTDGTIFEGKIFSARNLHPKALALLKPVMDLMNLGIARLGGFKSRGYGEVAIELDELRLIFPGRDLKDLSQEFEVKNLIPEKFDSLRVKKVNSDVEIAKNVFKADIIENSTFFGVEIRLKGEEVAKFFDSMLRMVKL
ncbi:MAG: RAMP superfamily CRISPR-associated protein [Archaeoglobaceae archaeon]